MLHDIRLHRQHFCLYLDSRDEGFHLQHIGTWDNDLRYTVLTYRPLLADQFCAALKSSRAGLGLLMLMAGLAVNRF